MNPYLVSQLRKERYTDLLRAAEVRKQAKAAKNGPASAPGRVREAAARRFLAIGYSLLGEGPSDPHLTERSNRQC